MSIVSCTTGSVTTPIVASGGASGSRTGRGVQERPPWRVLLEYVRPHAAMTARRPPRSERREPVVLAGLSTCIADTGRFQLLTVVSVLAGKHSLSRPARSSLSCRAPADAACAARSRQGSLAGTTRPLQGAGSYYRHVGRVIGTILGAILAMWLIFTAIGWFSAMLKTFVITALIAAVVFIVVWLLAGRRRQD